MDAISSPGNRIGISIIAVLAFSMCTAAATYRLKKTAEIKCLEKAMTAYAVQLEEENNAVLIAAGFSGE